MPTGSTRKKCHILRFASFSVKNSPSIWNLLTLAVLIIPVAAKSFAAQNAFTFKDVVKKAENLAHKPYHAPPSLPDYLNNLSYEQWKSIRFLSNKSPWPATNNFTLRFNHLGYLYKKPVRINLLNAQGDHRFRFSPKVFNYGATGIGQKVPDHLGFAGFNVYYPLNRPGSSDKVLSFLGASYFRAVGAKQWFGLSARGIAIDTASPSGEQRPYFKAFWLVRPAPHAIAIKIYALLDGNSVTGAYQFLVYPGNRTVIDVRAVLFLRKKVEKFGVAPLSSMFLQGSNSIRRYTTLVPQVHDSDGLSIRTQDDRWIWRPLQDPKRLEVYTFELNNPVGFGLMQRDRRFCSYESLSLHYQDRPSAWVTPLGKWGQGRIELIQIPSDTSDNDNIVAFWIPAHLPAPLQPIPVSYRISWQGDRMTLPSVGYVVSTRTGEGDRKKGARTFDIDFAGGDLGALSPKTISAVIKVDKPGKLLEHRIMANENSHGLRLEFQILPQGQQPIQLRAFLQKGNHVLTETWDYVYHPAR